MAKNLSSMPDYKARMPKSVHDVSQSTAFTSSVGMELPVYYDMLHTGDEIHFNAKMFTRMNPLSVGALAEIDIHLDYFFIPLSVMFTPSSSMFYQTNDLVSSVFSGSADGDTSPLNSSQFPLYNLNATLDAIRTLGVNSDSSKVSFDYSTSSGFDCAGKAAVRLLDLFDLSCFGLFGSNLTPNPNFTPWFLAAYQACHELYFRNDDREPKSYSYQLDRVYASTGSNPFSGDSSSVHSFYNSPGGALLRLNYVGAYKDYFNSVKVSPIASSVSMLDGENSFNILSQVNSFLFNSYGYSRVTSSGYLTPQTDSGLTTVGNSSGAGNTASALNAANIRQLFMVDKLLRVTGRAQKNYESQFLAHFGVKIPHDVMHNITHIGHDRVTLSPGQVISTADTFNGEMGSALGEVGGQGYAGLSGKKRSFKAPFHGVFMCIYHANPRMRYFGGINKLHDLSSPMSFWQPEYDRKGMQPIFSYEVNRDMTSFSSSSSSRIGWQFAYEQFKRKYDRVSAAFKIPISNSTVNEYSPWVLSRYPYGTTGQPVPNTSFTLGFVNLLTSPSFLDPIMQVRYNANWISNLTIGTYHLLFQTDPFIHDFRMECKKVNSMSQYGEPLLDS